MYNNLFKPIKINSLMFSNRVLSAPITGRLLPEKSQCGAAVNIVGCVCVGHPTGDWFRTGDPFSKYNCEETRKTLDFYRYGGSLVSAEIHHIGLWGENEYAVGPVDGVNARGVKYRAVTKKDIEEISDAFAKTCKDAKEFGFDMCMLHFGHGWLAMQFLSPAINKRTDEYGGSYENRARFPLEILKKVRQAVGPKYPLDMRISCREWLENEVSFDDMVHFVKDASQYIDMVNVSVGTDMEKLGAMHLTASQFEEHCCNKNYAKRIKEEVNIPVSVVGSIMTPEEAEYLIANGYCDMVTIGRQFLADPQWLKKAREGRSEDIVPCIRCNNCEHWSTERRLKACSVNPRLYRTEFIPEKIEKSEIKKHVVVVGGGPAGMKAAIVAKERGHEVDLLEKNSFLGGALQYADYDDYKQDLKRYKNYLIKQLEKNNIKVHLNVNATKEIVESYQPDEVIVAIGAEPFMPPITGIHNGVHALDIYPELDNTKNNIAIIGGGSIGCELAVELANRGRNIILIEATDRLHKQPSVFYDLAIDELISQRKQICCMLETKVLEIKENSIVVMDKDGNSKEIAVDQTIISVGLKPKQEESYAFYDIDCQVHMIGDCLNVGKIMDATEDAYFTASNL